MPACSSCWSSGIQATRRYIIRIVSFALRSLTKTPGLTYLTAANHRYNRDEGDWGFTRFAELRRLFASHWETGKGPMVENDTVNMTAYVRIYKDPTGVLWHNFNGSVPLSVLWHTVEAPRGVF